MPKNRKADQDQSADTVNKQDPHFSSALTPASTVENPPEPDGEPTDTVGSTDQTEAGALDTDMTAGTGESYLKPEDAPDPGAPDQNQGETATTTTQSQEPDNDNLLNVQYLGQDLYRGEQLRLSTADVASMDDTLRNVVFSTPLNEVGGYINPATGEYFIPGEHLAYALEEADRSREDQKEE